MMTGTAVLENIVLYKEHNNAQHLVISVSAIELSYVLILFIYDQNIFLSWTDANLTNFTKIGEKCLYCFFLRASILCTLFVPGGSRYIQ
jgi:hypothetical protein